MPQTKGFWLKIIVRYLTDRISNEIEIFVSESMLLFRDTRVKLLQNIFFFPTCCADAAYGRNSSWDCSEGALERHSARSTTASNQPERLLLSSLHSAYLRVWCISCITVNRGRSPVGSQLLWGIVCVADESLCWRGRKLKRQLLLRESDQTELSSRTEPLLVLRPDQRCNGDRLLRHNVKVQCGWIWRHPMAKNCWFFVFLFFVGFFFKELFSVGREVLAVWQK